jgi:LysR family pca operon transcriptional activator
MKTSVNLRHFHVFLEIVRLGSLVDAARAMNISQSAVSKTLAELEDALGVSLLERGRKGTHLTAAGTAFHANARQCVASFAKAVYDVEQNVRRRTALHVGALPTAAGSIVPTAVHRLALLHDDVTVRVHAGTYEYLIGMMRTGGLDLIVGRMISRDMIGLTFEKLYDEEIVAVCRRGHPLATGRSPTLDQLIDYPLIAPPPHSTVRGALDEFLLSGGASLRPLSVESLNDVFSRVYTLEFDAVWFVPLGTVSSDLKSELLVRLPLPGKLMSAPIGITRSADHALSDIGQAFVQILRETRSFG